MEHLHLKVNDKFRPEYHENDYDANCTFQGFPLRQGWHLDPSSGILTPDPNQKLPENRRIAFARFMQSWLFFGLIAAVVYDEHNRDFDYMRLVAPERDYICTTNLPEMLQEWRIWEMDPANSPGQKMRMIRAQLALDLARKVVIQNCSLENLEFEGYKGPKSLEANIAMSFMIIGETLTNAKARIIRQVGFHVRGWYGDSSIGWGTPRAVVKVMEDAGWCPRTIKILQAQLRDNASALLAVYASHASYTFKGHEHCRADRPCKASSQHPGKPDEYATKHHPECLHQAKGSIFHSGNDAPSVPNGFNSTSSGSACRGNRPGSENLREKEKHHDGSTCYTPCDAMIGVNMEEVIEILNKGKIPLLKFTKGASRNMITLEVTDNSRSPEYATISHVWADGYGNTKDNKLYRCQLDYFSELLKEAQKQRMRFRMGQAGKKPEPLPFWIDTLLIPVQKTQTHRDARRKAIHQIYNVFSKAKYTIVIDNGLNDMALDDKDYTVTAMRILASGWMRRLWTLQEAFLSRKLLFAFKSGGSDVRPLVDLDDIEDWYDETDTELVSNLPATAQSYYNNLLGPDRKARIHNLTSTNAVGLIASVWRAAQWRTTSHVEHETLALATLLNLNLEKKSFGTAQLLPDNAGTKQKLDEMMRDFWLVLEENSPGAIPPGIIFLPGDRIREQGFGWAPTTWMSADGIDHPDPISMTSRAATLSTQNRGLLVEYPGFLLHYQNRNAIVGATDGQGFWFPSDNTLTEWYHVEWADYRTYSANKGIIDEWRSEDLAIILCRPRPRQIAEIGLLVEIHETVEQRELGKDEVNRVFAVYMLRRVTLRRETNEDRLQKKKEEILDSRKPDNQRKIIFGEVLEDHQKWYVDCRMTSVKSDHKQSGESSSPNQHVASTVRDRPILLRGATETGMQAESERGTPRAGTEATDDEKRTVKSGVQGNGLVTEHSNFTTPANQRTRKMEKPEPEEEPPVPGDSVEGLAFANMRPTGKIG
ncbi:hypothetical protein N0V83_004157 [Neocucurbitaria cava]|uniref:Heterokaryon incompatibility domain-containing protein n=1 Tax=Neocucurbitaria cava TaxID=798079 RepID=A0A9W9CNT4_9PLEO|nr:hypothetical protein N0V83_004157 [Neocucurbitaria cava]